MIMLLNILVLFFVFLNGMANQTVFPNVGRFVYFCSQMPPSRSPPEVTPGTEAALER